MMKENAYYYDSRINAVINFLEFDGYYYWFVDVDNDNQYPYYENELDSLVLYQEVAKVSEYLIYGKRLAVKDPKTGQIITDSMFRALDSGGHRVTKLSDAMSYATREDAQAILDKPATKARIDAGEVAFQIRKAKQWKNQF